MRPFWTLILLGIVAGCASVRDVSEDSTTRAQIGRSFRLKADVYLCTYTYVTDTKLPLIDMPSSATRGIANPRLPEVVDRKNMDRFEYDIHIVGVLSKGSTLRFEQILSYSSPSADYLTVVMSTSDAQFPQVAYRFPAIGGLAAARSLDFGLSPWFFAEYCEEEPNQSTETTRGK